LFCFFDLPRKPGFSLGAGLLGGGAFFGGGAFLIVAFPVLVRPRIPYCCQKWNSPPLPEGAAIKALALLIAAKGSERAAIEYAFTLCKKEQGPE
jgi:hypothetical protein